MAMDWESLFEAETDVIQTGMVDTRFLAARLNQLYVHSTGFDHKTEKSNITVQDQDADDNNTDDADTTINLDSAAAEIALTPDPISMDSLRKQLDNYQCPIPLLEDYLDSSRVSDRSLRLWLLLINNFPLTASKIPHTIVRLVHRGGVPPALRALVWRSIACSGTDHYDDLSSLQSLYDSFAAEWTPYVDIIARDLHRTFPDVPIFQERGGEGQMKLGKVLRAYSAYDIEIGYCQGLTFLVAPLLLHMTDNAAFCVLVKLMENYDLRSMFTPDMHGLPVRLYQLDSLLKQYLPKVAAHFEHLKVTTLYASQWFLSLFATTCPLSMLVRIIDLIILEGATETLMRTALAVINRNAPLLFDMEYDDEVLAFLLSKNLWDIYGFNGDLLVEDVLSFNHISPQTIAMLASDYRKSSSNKPPSKISSSSVPSLTPIGNSMLSNATSTTATPASVSSLPHLPTRESADWVVNRSYTSSVRSFDTSSSIVSNSTIATSCTGNAGQTQIPLLSSQPCDITDLEREIERLKRELEKEQNRRRMDRFSVMEFVNAVSHRDLNTASLRQQFDIPVPSLSLESTPAGSPTSASSPTFTNESTLGPIGLSEDQPSQNPHENQIPNSLLTLKDESQCSNCDSLRMELVICKTNDTLTRQINEELHHQLQSLTILKIDTDIRSNSPTKNLSSKNSPMKRSTTPTVTPTTKSGNRSAGQSPIKGLATGWNLWSTKNTVDDGKLNNA
ncbi:RabGAP/TBC [Nadsonia fulvescens var. elongata DSM 6958]|uniref:RabGAP/TBC n=1 Tax=Nadsonia fulvescens var. elongata DSM 6958 TaxID=857566 RepID=A0A1E3PF11_9ASCO|nr:RabGAP/TBC [Nadsonia fulvescens var. elongata DSM 6958]